MGVSSTKPGPLTLSPDVNPQSDVSPTYAPATEKKISRNPITPGVSAPNDGFSSISASPYGDNRKSSGQIGLKYRVDTKGLTRSNSIKSTYVGNMAISKQEKVHQVMSNEDRELARLQRIYEIEQENAEKRRRKLEASLQRQDQKAYLNKQFLKEREVTVRERNNQALARAKELESEIREKRQSAILDRQMGQAEALRRKEQERLRQERLRQEENANRSRAYNAKIDQYQQEYNQRMASLDRKLQSKHITAEQYKEQSAQAN